MGGENYLPFVKGERCWGATAACGAAGGQAGSNGYGIQLIWSACLKPLY